MTPFKINTHARRQERLSKRFLSSWLARKARSRFQPHGESRTQEHEALSTSLYRTTYKKGDRSQLEQNRCLVKIRTQEAPESVFRSFLPIITSRGAGHRTSPYLLTAASPLALASSTPHAFTRRNGNLSARSTPTDDKKTKRFSLPPLKKRNRTTDVTTAQPQYQVPV